MPRVYVGIGSNIDREHNLRGAVHELAAHYGPLMLSPVYESRAVGFEGENFYNLVAGFDTSESIESIREILSRIESQFGRTRRENRYSARTLDLDLLLYGDAVRHDAEANLPHPDIRRYAFVLRPLADIAPDLTHPETRQTCAEMWAQFETEKKNIWKAAFELRS